jgi:hypothetical protein
MEEAIQHIRIKALAYFEVANEETEVSVKNKLNDKGLLLADLVAELEKINKVKTV